MEISELRGAAGSGLRKACVAIGSFDGVHLGHQVVIQAMLRQARAEDMAALVLTFDPPPKVAFGRASPICSVRERVARLYALGVDAVHVVPFDAAYASRSAEQFLEDLAALGTVEAYVGSDFRFGHQRRGNCDLLATRFRVVITSNVVCPEGERISSTRIRELRGSGNVRGARNLLGLLPGAAPIPTEPWTLEADLLQDGEQ